MAKIGFYILFLFTLVVYLLLTMYAQKKQQESLVKRKASVFFAGQIALLAGLIPVLIIPWVTTGFFSVNFTFAILITFEGTALLLALFYRVMRINAREVVNNVVVWGAETTLRYPRLFTQVVPLVGLLGLFAYFVSATYTYFANPRGSATAVNGILTVSMALFIAGSLFTLIPTVMQVASYRINNTARRALFFSQATTALQMGVIFTIYLGLIGFDAQKLAPRALPVPHSILQYSPMILLLVFYLLVLVIPYFSGLESRRRKEIAMFERLLDRISKVIDAIGIPSADDETQLRDLQAKFKSDNDEWMKTEPILELAAEIDKLGPNPEPDDPNVKALIIAYEDFKTHDPRIINQEAIKALDGKLTEIIAEYARIQPQPNNLELHIELNRSIEDHFRDQRGHYEGMIRKAEDIKILAPVLARVAGVAGAVPVVMQYGQKLLQLLSTSH